MVSQKRKRQDGNSENKKRRQHKPRTEVTINGVKYKKPPKDIWTFHTGQIRVKILNMQKTKYYKFVPTKEELKKYNEKAIEVIANAHAVEMNALVILFRNRYKNDEFKFTEAEKAFLYNYYMCKVLGEICEYGKKLVQSVLDKIEPNFKATVKEIETNCKINKRRGYVHPDKRKHTSKPRTWTRERTKTPMNKQVMKEVSQKLVHSYRNMADCVIEVEKIPKKEIDHEEENPKKVNKKVEEEPEPKKDCALEKLVDVACARIEIERSSGSESEPQSTTEPESTEPIRLSVHLGKKKKKPRRKKTVNVFGLELCSEDEDVEQEVQYCQTMDFSKMYKPGSSNLGISVCCGDKMVLLKTNESNNNEQTISGSASSLDTLEKKLQRAFSS